MPIEVMAVVPEGPPIKFRQGGAEHKILRAWGPERIETGWWRGQDIHRDYYSIETDKGTRLWIFRRHDDGRWFVHGCFD
jgi:protein ImuB